MKLLESIQTFIERHTLSFLLFLLGTILIFLAVTNSLDLPGLKGIVPYQDYRLISLIIGVISIFLSILLYYLPPPAARAIPDALKLTLFERRDKLLGRTQKNFLSFIEEESTKNIYGVQQDILEKKYSNRSRAEVYYRLEQLWLLGFLEKEKVSSSPHDIPRYIYRLSPEYRKVLGRQKSVKI